VNETAGLSINGVGTITIGSAGVYEISWGWSNSVFGIANAPCCFGLHKNGNNLGAQYTLSTNYILLTGNSSELLGASGTQTSNIATFAAGDKLELRNSFNPALFNVFNILYNSVNNSINSWVNGSTCAYIKLLKLN